MASGNNKALDNVIFPYKDYILALPGWYPTWLDPLPGDFNQRHIKAASLFKPQIVLYIGKDTTGTLSKAELRVNHLTETAIEIIFIYPKGKMLLLDAFRSNFLFLRYLFMYGKIIRQKFGKPALLHSYIVMRGGLAGLLLSKRWKIPFILTENWTIYYPADPGYLPKRNFVFKWLVKKIFNNVKRFLPVTENLRDQSAKLLGSVPSTVIPNAVETNIFNYQSSPVDAVFTFIHVSTMEYQKNPEGLLRCFKKFNEKYTGTFLQMVGPYPPAVAQYAFSIGLNDANIEFTGAVSYTIVAEQLKKAHALVLFSRYENLPCVILEAFCAGLPVISTRVGGIAEVINKGNGILVDSENEQQLVEAMMKIYLEYQVYYDRGAISKEASQNFSYEAVGRKINEVYKQVIS
jgi:glycosyltransferase involved in cell wall biosynthesis